MLALFPPALFAGIAPAALYSDTGGAVAGSSFVGSCSGSACGNGTLFNASGVTSEGWGPSYGWDLGLGAFGLWLVSIVLARRAAGRAASTADVPGGATQAPSGPEVEPASVPPHVVEDSPPAVAGNRVCPHCGASFFTSDALRAHQLDYHRTT